MFSKPVISKKDCSFNAMVPTILNYTQSPKEDELDSTIFGLIEQLWADSGIQACFQKRSSLQIPDSTKYFLDNISRVTSVGYIPSNKVKKMLYNFCFWTTFLLFLQDILLSRRKTTGVIEYKFTLDSESHFNFRLIDVGGENYS